ncbi:endo-arabinase [Biscogniauxia sp. FL1348]|nr:endo-arabinase [Biscogniauxia sp. FL1348]
MHFFSTLAALGQMLILARPVLSAPVVSRPPQGLGEGPALAADFPDPSIIKVDDKWYAFATAHGNKQVQVARADKLYGDWELLDIDALPESPSWATGMNTWAPDVRQVGNGSFVMYFSGQSAVNKAHHCVGVATSSTILGPYTPVDTPFACDLTVGGAIDPSGFRDADGKQYVAYKIDGNSIGNGGSCGNTVAPIMKTPIMLQEVAQDGVSKIGAPVQILDRIEEDGPLVEAPSIMRTAAGLYVMTFSSGCFTAPTYDLDYATADSVKGPYTRAKSPVAKTKKFGLTSPGGATVVSYGDVNDQQPSIAFHANCKQGRCLYTSEIDFDDSDMTISLVM